MPLPETMEPDEEQVTVRLSKEQYETATALGDGHPQDGIRAALDVAWHAVQEEDEL